MRRTLRELLSEDLIARAPLAGTQLLDGPSSGAWALPGSFRSPWQGEVAWGERGVEVRQLRCRTQPDDHETVETVAKEIRWERVEVDHPLSGRVELPLRPEHHLGQLRLSHVAYVPSPRGLWPEGCEPCAGWLGLYGYEWRQGRWSPWPERTRRAFLAGEAISWPRLHDRAQRAPAGPLAAWLAPSPRILVGIGFAVCPEDTRFEPFSIAWAARFFPYVYVRCSDRLDGLRGQFRLERPEATGCGGGHGAVRPFLAADRDDVDWPGPRPVWDRTFAWYDLEPSPRRVVVVRRATDTVVNDPAAREERRDGAWHPSPSARGARQGAFDSLHLAPRMTWAGGEEVMAPICAHSCVHVHWRWGRELGRTVLKPDPLLSPSWLNGWEGGRPFARQGAPLVPENQEVSIEIEGGPAFRHEVDQLGAEPEVAHVLWHHGAAFMTALRLLPDLLALPDDVEGWGRYYHSLRYDAEVGGEERLRFPKGVGALSGEG